MNPADLLAFALSEQRTVMTDPSGSVTVELTADGSITAIRLSEAGHQMTPAAAAELIMSLHTAGLTQAQKAIEAALSDGEPSDIPELDLQNTSPTPTSEATAPAEPVPAAPTIHTDPWRSSKPAAPTAPPWSAPTGHQETPRPHDQSRTAASPSTGTVVPHHAAPSPPHSLRDSAPSYAEDPVDEDEYFRTFSVFEYDDHNPRG